MNVSSIFEFPPGHPGSVDSLEMLEFKWRPRASVGVADHSLGELVPAGFVEVVP